MDEQQPQDLIVEYGEEFLEGVRAAIQEVAEGHVHRFDSAAELLAAIDAAEDEDDDPE